MTRSIVTKPNSSSSVFSTANHAPESIAADVGDLAKKVAALLDEPENWRENDDTLWLDECHLSGFYQDARKRGTLSIDNIALDQLAIPLEVIEHAGRIIYYPREQDEPRLLKVLKSRSGVLGVYPASSFRHVAKSYHVRTADLLEAAITVDGPAHLDSRFDQIIELSNDIKRKERETGKVPNTIPPKNMSMPIVKHKLPTLSNDDIVSAQPLINSPNVFMERNADGTKTLHFRPSTPFEWRYVIRPVRKLVRRASTCHPYETGADRRDGWES